jgi:nucleoside-diphosphate-sugar epimerase
MELQGQRERVYDSILRYFEGGEPARNIAVFRESGGHHRHFVQVRDGSQYFIFYTALNRRIGGSYEVSDGKMAHYENVRELRNPVGVRDNISWEPSVRTYVGDMPCAQGSAQRVNDTLLSIVLTTAAGGSVRELKRPELIGMLRGASVLPA